MKYKTTIKAIINGCFNVKCAGFCDLQYLLSNHSPVAYNSGVYGWNFDVYTVYGVTICTGYRRMPGERLQHIIKYEQMAKAAMPDRERVESILKEFCAANGGVAY